jgi:hypothetical protein
MRQTCQVNEKRWMDGWMKCPATTSLSPLIKLSRALGRLRSECVRRKQSKNRVKRSHRRQILLSRRGGREGVALTD